MASSNGYQQHEKKQAQEDAKKSWREQLKDLSNAYGNIPDAFRLVWAASPGTTLVMLLLTLVWALLPPAQAWVGKLTASS